MSTRRYRSMDMTGRLDRRQFVKAAGAGTAAAGALAFAPLTFGQAAARRARHHHQHRRLPEGPQDAALAPRAVPRQGGEGHRPPLVRQREVRRARSSSEMVLKGITTLTGRNAKDSFRLLIDPRDVVGLKVNPVGPPLINTQAGSRRSGHPVAGGQRHPEVQHRHLGPVRLHAQGRGLHQGAVPGHRDRGAADDGRGRATSGGARTGSTCR